MSSHRVLSDEYKAYVLNGPGRITDPGDTETITVTMQDQVCSVVTEGVETRDLARPTRPGIRCVVVLDTDGGNLTLTVVGGYNRDGDEDIVYADAQDFVAFTSIKAGTSYYWRILAQEGTDASVEEGTFDSVTTHNLAATGQTLLSKAGIGAGDTVLAFGNGLEGMEIVVSDVVTTLTAAVTDDTTIVIPAGAVVLSVQGNLDTAVVPDGSGDTLMEAVGIGISGGDVNIFGFFSTLTQNTKSNIQPDWAVLAGATTVALYALKTDDDTPSTEVPTAGALVRVRVTYIISDPLADAA